MLPELHRLSCFDTMDMFSDLDINSPVTSTVVTASDLTSTVENALQFDESPNDFNMAFFDVTPYRKEGYEESQPLAYETSTSADSVFSGLPPYPNSDRVDSGVVSPPAVVSSGMSSQSSMSSLYRQPHSTYQRSMSTFSMIESKKKNAESSGQRGHKRSLSSGKSFKQISLVIMYLMCKSMTRFKILLKMCFFKVS